MILQNIRTRVTLVTLVNITPGANLNCIQNSIDIFSILNSSLLSGDGQKVMLKEISVNMEFQMLDEVNLSKLAVIPFIVQTAGTFTSTQNLANSSLEELLDTCIDDEFGLYLLRDIVFSKVKLRDQSADYAQANVRLTFKVPKHLLALINKEQQTERLQDLYIGFYLVPSGNNAVRTAVVAFYKYGLTSKGITRK